MVNGEHQEARDNPFDYGAINKQSKYWAFTLNNPTDTEEAELETLVTTGKATYLVFGREHWDEPGRTPHLQGYIELPKLLRRRGVVSLPGMRRCSVGTRYSHSTAENASEYCKKEGAYKEMGTISKPRPGKRTDLERIADIFRDGGTVRDVARELPSAFIRYHAGIERLHTMLHENKFEAPVHPARWEKPDVIKALILHGPSGSGKTTAAKNWLPNALWVRHMDDLASFDPDVHEGIIFDDMAFRHMPREAQIHLTDWDDDSSIHIRYRIIRIPANTPKIFTCNHANAVFIEDRAIDRRVSYFLAE